MTSEKKELSPNTDLQVGLNGLGREEWMRVCAFFNAARYNNPTTEQDMRTKLGMTNSEPFKPEFQEAVDLFDDLSDVALDFETNVRGKVLSLADDIYQYSILADAVYDRFAELVDKFDWDGPDGVQDKLDELVKHWKNQSISGRSEKIKIRIKQILDQLIVEASSRATQAETLHKAILAPETGIKHRVLQVKKGFDQNHTRFEDKFGAESADVTNLKLSVASLEDELKGLRKKEHDEVIVLSSSPVYLLIPGFGPFILAGVDIGVGIDLANVRAKIKSKQAEADAVNAKLKVSERFVTHYHAGSDLVEQISKDITELTPRLEKLGNGWRTIASDIGKISNMLSDQGVKQLAQEKWGNMIVTLGTTKTLWINVGKRADHFRNFSVPKPITNVIEINETPKAA